MREKKTTSEAFESLNDAVSEFFEEAMTEFENWWQTGIDMLPPTAKNLADKLKEKGYKIVRDD